MQNLHTQDCATRKLFRVSPLGSMAWHVSVRPVYRLGRCSFVVNAMRPTFAFYVEGLELLAENTTV
jgi:hypothetical protein